MCSQLLHSGILFGCVNLYYLFLSSFFSPVFSFSEPFPPHLDMCSPPQSLHVVFASWNEMLCLLYWLWSSSGSSCENNSCIWLCGMCEGTSSFLHASRPFGLGLPSCQQWIMVFYWWDEIGVVPAGMAIDGLQCVRHKVSSSWGIKRLSNPYWPLRRGVIHDM